MTSNPKITHYVEFKKEGEIYKRQPACGKTDLFNILREMMNDGYTEFKITVIKTPKTITESDFI